MPGGEGRAGSTTVSNITKRKENHGREAKQQYEALTRRHQEAVPEIFSKMQERWLSG